MSNFNKKTFLIIVTFAATDSIALITSHPDLDIIFQFKQITLVYTG